MGKFLKVGRIYRTCIKLSMENKTLGKQKVSLLNFYLVDMVTTGASWLLYSGREYKKQGVRS